MGPCNGAPVLRGEPALCLGGVAGSEVGYFHLGRLADRASCCHIIHMAGNVSIKTDMSGCCMSKRYC